MSQNPLDELVEQVGAWTDENFGDQPAENPLMGIDEELGELSRSFLKRRQGIRKEDVGPEYERDEIADVVIYLCDWMYRTDNRFHVEFEPEGFDSLYDGWKKTNKIYTDLIMIEDAYVAHRLIECLWGLADLRGYDFLNCVENKWHEVSDRTWNSRYVD